MDSLLDALQEGRLIELPDNDKVNALLFLAHILEAIPSLPVGTDVAELVLAKEKNTRTALGKGWACPDARVPFEADLICVVGWSPRDIDYGAPDNVSVRIIAMYLVPENQRSNYLREVSLLAKALAAYPGFDRLGEDTELNDVRNHLLDMISSTKEMVGPDSRARMIRLQAKPSVAEVPVSDLANLMVEPVTIITSNGSKPMVLGHDLNLVRWLDTASGLTADLSANGFFKVHDWRIIKRSEVSYQGTRTLYDCLAVRATGDKPRSGK